MKRESVKILGKRKRENKNKRNSFIKQVLGSVKTLFIFFLNKKPLTSKPPNPSKSICHNHPSPLDDRCANLPISVQTSRNPSPLILCRQSFPVIVLSRAVRVNQVSSVVQTNNEADRLHAACLSRPLRRAIRQPSLELHPTTSEIVVHPSTLSQFPSVERR